MHYEINVAQQDPRNPARYLHLFATHERSLQTQQQVDEVLSRLLPAFPKPQYEVTVSRVEQRYIPVTTLKQLNLEG